MKTERTIILILFSLVSNQSFARNAYKADEPCVKVTYVGSVAEGKKIAPQLWLHPSIESWKESSGEKACAGFFQEPDKFTDSTAGYFYAFLVGMPCPPADTSFVANLTHPMAANDATLPDRLSIPSGDICGAGTSSIVARALDQGSHATPKTYSNKAYGFELQLPMVWRVDDGGDSYIVFEPIKASDRVEQSISLDIESIEPGTSISTYVKSKFGPGPGSKSSNFIIDGTPAKKVMYFEHDDVDGSSAKSKSPIRDYVVIHDGKAYTFEVLGKSNVNVDPILKFILKSFRFVST